jgi:glycosyltransferase involved in cell wall biosynthesis
MKKQPGIVVAGGIFAHKKWPQHYQQELKQLDVPIFLRKIPFFPGSILLLFFSSALSCWIKKLYDAFMPQSLVIHIHQGPLSGLHMPIRVSLPCPIAIVATFHGGVFQYYKAHKKMLFALLAQRLIKYDKDNLALTSVDRSGIITHSQLFGFNKKDFHYIPNPVEDKSLSGCPRLIDPEAPFTVGFVGVLDVNKGWDLIGKAVEELHQNGKKIKYLIAGNGPDYNAAAAWAQERPQYVNFKGYVDNALENLMPHLDVLVVPSILEGAPMVILEALSCGVPVIATPVGGIPDIIADHQNGFLIDREPSSIVAALNKLIEDFSLHLNMSKCAKQTFQERFEINKIGQSYFTLYKKLLSNQRDVGFN